MKEYLIFAVFIFLSVSICGLIGFSMEPEPSPSFGVQDAIIEAQQVYFDNMSIHEFTY
jgi:hypothetical protein